MKSTMTDDQETIRQMVRGEIPWTQLKAIGISIDLEGNRCKIENPRGIVAKADVHDLAKGLLSYLNNVAELRQWACLLEARFHLLGPRRGGPSVRRPNVANLMESIVRRTDFRG